MHLPGSMSCSPAFFDRTCMGERTTLNISYVHVRNDPENNAYYLPFREN
uniref:Uncharacterized protein n=1 Tax=Arundo donax TaxID=35708 RepID=A0A0A9HR85_ARUDO